MSTQNSFVPSEAQEMSAPWAALYSSQPALPADRGTQLYQLATQAHGSQSFYLVPTLIIATFQPAVSTCPGAAMYSAPSNCAHELVQDGEFE